jgi:hypothetical protein
LVCYAAIRRLRHRKPRNTRGESVTCLRRGPQERRPGNVHSADGWKAILKPIIEKYTDHHLMRFFRADAAFAIPERYKTLETAGYFYAIRLRANRVVQFRIAHLLKRPVGRPPKGVKRVCGGFEYQAVSWDKPRRVVAKVEWHPGELFQRVGFVVINLLMAPDWIIRNTNQRRTAEQHLLGTLLRNTLPGNTSRKASKRSTGRGCPARARRRTRSAFGFMRWPIISVSSCKALICLPRWLTGR